MFSRSTISVIPPTFSVNLVAGMNQLAKEHREGPILDVDHVGYQIILRESQIEDYCKDSQIIPQQPAILA